MCPRCRPAFGAPCARAAWPAPSGGGGPGGGGGGAPPPGLPAEELLAALWAGVLGLEPPAADADFFALGGHSLLAMQLVSRVNQAFGIELPLRCVFEQPTLGEMARAIAAERATQTGGGGGAGSAGAAAARP